MERSGFSPRAARGHLAPGIALLPGLSLSLLHEDDQRRHPGDPRLSRDPDAGAQFGAAAGAALAAELSRGNARLGLAVLQARHPGARPAKEPRMEPGPLS